MSFTPLKSCPRRCLWPCELRQRFKCPVLLIAARLPTRTEDKNSLPCLFVRLPGSWSRHRLLCTRIIVSAAVTCTLFCRWRRSQREDTVLLL